MIGACTIGKRRLLRRARPLRRRGVRPAHGLRDRRLGAARPRRDRALARRRLPRRELDGLGRASTRPRATGSRSRSRSPAPRSRSTSPPPTTRRRASRTCRRASALGRDPDRVPDADQRRRGRRADERGPVRAGARRCSGEGSLLDPRFPASTIFGNQMCDEVLESIMLALADALPDRVTAGWNQLLCTALAGDRPAHAAAVGLAVDLHARRPGGDAGRRRLRRARLLGHARVDALAGHGDVRALDAALHGVLRVPARLGRRGRVARRPRHDARAGASTAIDELGVTIGDDAASEGADPAPGLFGGEPAGLNELRLHFPDGTRAGLGLEGDRARHPAGHGLRCAQRRRGRLRRPAGAATRGRCWRRCATACSRAEKARTSYGVAVLPTAGGRSTRPRRRGSGAAPGELPRRHRRRRHVHRLPA